MVLADRGGGHLTPRISTNEQNRLKMGGHFQGVLPPWTEVAFSRQLEKKWVLRNGISVYSLKKIGMPMSFGKRLADL